MKTTVRYWTTLLPVSVRPDFHVHLAKWKKISFLSWWISIFQRNIVTGSCDKDGLITLSTSEVYRSESGCTLVNLFKKKKFINLISNDCSVIIL